MKGNVKGYPLHPKIPYMASGEGSERGASQGTGELSLRCPTLAHFRILTLILDGNSQPRPQRMQPPPILSRDIKVPSLTSFSHCKRLAFAESPEKLRGHTERKKKSPQRNRGGRRICCLSLSFSPTTTNHSPAASRDPHPFLLARYPLIHSHLSPPLQRKACGPMPEGRWDQWLVRRGGSELPVGCCCSVVRSIDSRAWLPMFKSELHH